MQTMKVNTFRALRRIAIAQLPTKWGQSQAIGFELQSDDGIQRLQTAIVLILGKETPTTGLQSDAHTASRSLAHTQIGFAAIEQVSVLFCSSLSVRSGGHLRS